MADKAEIKRVNNGYVVTSWPTYSAVERVYTTLDTALAEVAMAVGGLDHFPLGSKVEVTRQQKKISTT